MLNKSGYHIPELFFLPKDYSSYINNLILEEKIYLYPTKDRRSKVGDYRFIPSYGIHKITVNSTLEPIYFLLTFLHELAHKRCFEKYQRSVKPHGREWKHEFYQLLSEIPIFISGQELTIWNDYKRKVPTKFTHQKSENPEYTVIAGDLNPNDQFETETKISFQIIKKNRSRMICKNLGNNKLYHVPKKLLVKKLF